MSLPEQHTDIIIYFCYNRNLIGSLAISYMCVYIYIYIYIERERERERNDRFGKSKKIKKINGKVDKPKY